MDSCVTFQSKNSSCVRVMKGVALEVAVENLDRGVGHRHDARDLSVGLPGTAVKRENTVVHLKDSALDHHDAVHAVFHIEFSDTVLTPILIELDALLVCFHIQLFVWTSHHHFKVVNCANFLWPYVDDEAGLALLADCHVERLFDRLQNNSWFSAKKGRKFELTYLITKDSQ